VTAVGGENFVELPKHGVSDDFVLEHTHPDGSRHINDCGVPFDALTMMTGGPSSSIGDFEVDDRSLPGDPLPE
jgi:hypothetical protein